MAPNLLYCQSGGVTAVINASASAVISTARKFRSRIGEVYAARNGILGVLREELYSASSMSLDEVRALAHTPGGAFGSCRFKLRGPEQDAARYQRLIDVCKAHDIRYFLYNGGNDSADTALKIGQFAEQHGYPLQALSIPKTIDNDLAVTDVCPGFPSAAKYVAVSTLEATLDVASMAESSTKVFVLEVMGRHAGWLAAAGALAARREGDLPILILFPELPFDEAKFIPEVKRMVETHGYCTVVVSEGVKDSSGTFLSETGRRDAFGHAQLGGVAPLIASRIGAQLGYKFHWAVADYLQRSARHLASKVDLDIALKVGEAAVRMALAGKRGVMPTIKRIGQRPYRFSIEETPLAQIANVERKMPSEFIRADGFGITEAARRYLLPLIAGEAYPPYRDGLPSYVQPKLRLVRQQLPAFGE